MEKLYGAYYLKVYSFAMNIVKDPCVAEEIAQDTFVRAMTSKNAYRGAAGEYTWLCAIAKNLCHDYFRAEGKKAEFPEGYEPVSEGTDQEKDLIARETSLAIHRILHGLEEPYREVFELRVFGELSFTEIASVFGKTDSWARVTYHRARLKIRERMVGDEGYRVQ